CTDAEIPGIIQRVHRQHGYVADPHTACAFKELNPQRTSVVLSTAHPAKFPAAIRDAIGQEPTAPALDELKSRPIVKHRLPADAEAIKAFITQRAV
ncbi:MAG: threonine synthase, partial [Verrucomicrobiota bacterium]|nr:threonine synthase [Verrucomicrobiota bacterium]